VLYAREDWLQNGDVVERFLRGVAQGIETSQANPDQVSALVADVLKTTPEIARRAWDEAGTQIEANGRLPDAKSMDTFWEIGKLAGQWDAPIPESEWLDSRWIDSYATWSKGS
jgi:ABC-type nitrate/sulfonate/bicarbonate transport system substrate-binding protein